MKTTTNSLQEIIEERAEKRLTKDLKALAEYITNNRLLNENNDTEIPKIIYNGVEQTFKGLFWINGRYFSGTYIIELKKLWLPTYIKEETKSFVEKVDSFQEQLDDLKSGVNQDLD